MSAVNCYCSNLTEGHTQNSIRDRQPQRTKGMVEHAALLVDEILPQASYRQWVLSVPFQMRFLFASKPEVMRKALGIVYRTIAIHLIHTAGHTLVTAHTGAITFIQRFGSALNLNIHFHVLFLDGAYASHKANELAFKHINAPTKDQLQAVAQRISERLAKPLTVIDLHRAVAG
jgi:Putative transposase